ncbi:hypothetical protein P256_02380 [Acinetobacter nectaris CIP 110549]|uniref:FAD/NAD(P)-binding domain-containing protein n=1 Tax=Acinetobacter nectaris CIP 110549 TaxID=1392540 RepID=V2TNE4_9GAMM|nr:NAD(P)/FAD-dependent oxidoreductase [Acinetobacter nectaris]ESK37325.1 hypothetical protein P256_02380 [Acinetobacter nectaris CIP 110549]
MKVIDSVIVDGGISGLAAALFLGRAKRSVCVFDDKKSNILAVDKVREHLGFDGVSPEVMLNNARKEVLNYGVNIIEEHVSNIHPLENGWFEVISENKRIITKTVILATGIHYEKPNILGISPLWGKDLRVCPCFDGYEVAEKKFIVFGIHERLAHMASWVSMWSDNITVISPHKFDEQEEKKLKLLNIQIIQDDIQELIHEQNKLTAVRTIRGDYVPCDATWVALKTYAKSSEFTSTLCKTNQDGTVITNHLGETSQKGVYAIGNITQPWDHLAHASASGTRIGPIVTNYLLEQRILELKQPKV